MTHIHYKFSSKLSSDTVIFDGPHITLRELKRQIMGREKLRSGDCDLQITNAQTKEEYKEDEGLIPKGSSVIVRRIPIIGARSGSTSKTRNVEQPGVLPQFHNFRGVSAMDDQSSSRTSPLFSKMTNLAVEDVSEEDKIKAVLYQSTYNTMNYSTKSGTGLPANYTCYRCGNTGHHIRNCPTTGDKSAEAPLRLKKSTGIPRSFMVEVDDPSIKGAMLTNSGQYAIPAMHAKAYAIGKKEKPPFIPQETPTPTAEEPVPNELVCLICHELLSDAVVIPCCGNSFCDECIRTALLDSDQHCCPSCGQSDVSPDTLIANKFLRKAVNTFQIERGQRITLTRGCGATQSQNPTLALSPVPTLPPLSVQSQPQKPRSLQAADPTPVSQVSGLPPTATGHTPASIKPSTSSQPAQSNQERSEYAADVSASPPELISLREAAPAASQATEAAAIEQLQTVGGILQQSSSDSAPGHCQPSTSMDSSETCPSKGVSSSSSSYPSVPPPLFTSPHFNPFLSAQQHLTSYPPGYPPAMPIWMLQTPPGSEWYTQQRRKNERSPPRESTYRHSSSHLNSKSPKSKSSRSYSRSSSRSRSRSRSLSRSRPHSPYSRHRGLHARSHSSYSYGYKRSPTPSSSSSPRLGRRSRSKSPSDHRKKSHSHHHHGKKSSSSRHGTRRRGESPRRGAGGSEKSSLHAQHTERDSSFDLEQQRYLQWEREYKEWCEKYFNSYVSHFHQLPPAPFNLNPASLAPWGDKEGNRNINTEYRLHDRRAARKDDLSPPSQSSSDSYSTQSQSISDTRSSPSHSSNESRSPRSQSSSDGLSTPTVPKELKHRHAGKHKQLPVALTEGSDDSELQERRRNDKQLVTKKDENTSTLKHKRRRTKRDEEERGKEPSSRDAADSVDDGRRDQRSYDTAQKASKDGSPRQEKETASEALDADQQVVKSDKHLDKDYEIKGRRKEKGGERGRYSRQDIEGHHKGKPSKERVRINTDKYRQPGGKSASDSRSEKTQKRKGEDSVSSAQPRSSKCQKTDKSEEPQTCKSESQDPFDKKKPETEETKERKTRPPTESYIWEGGMKVKSQKRISINISLGGRRKEEKGDKDPTYLDNVAGKTGEEHEGTNSANNGKEMKLEKENDEENEKKEDIKQDEIEPSPIWDIATSGDHMKQMEEETYGEKTAERVDEGFDSWHFALRGTEEELEGSKQRKENQLLQASDREKWRSIGDGNTEGKERTDGGGQDMESLVVGTQKEGAEGEDTLGENRGTPPGEMTEEVMPRMTREEDRTRTSLHGGPHITVVDVSSEDHQERETVVTTQEQYTEGGATNGEDKPALIQVPCSEWDKEESEENKQYEGNIRVETDAPAVFHPLKSVRVTEETTPSGETDREKNQQRHGDTERHRAGAMDRGQTREKERNTAVPSSQRRLAPSSGKDRPDSASSNRRDSERDRRMDTEGQDRERGRINKSPRDERKESQRSKERTRKEEKRSSNSSKASDYRRSSPSSSHSATQKMDSRIKDKQSSHHHHHHYPESQSSHYLHKDRRVGSHQSSPSHSGSRSKDRDRTSSPLEELSGRNRSRVAKEEWKAKRAAEVMKEDKRPRHDRDGGRCEERVDALNAKWELEEGERPSSSSSSKSSSSSTGRESFSKERGNELKRKHKEEKRRVSPEPLDDWMLRKHTHTGSERD